MSEETIVAISTARGGAKRGIVRMSGPEALAIASRVFIADEGEPQLEKLGRYRAVRGKVRFGDSEPPLFAEAKLYVMKAPKSYTREDVAEIHAPSAAPLLAELAGRCVKEGARLAEPGEFTKRAFLNGRIDLLQAESVINLIRATSDAEARLAASFLEGDFSMNLRRLAESVEDLLAEMEAGLDFSEDDVQVISPGDTALILDDVAAQLDELIEDEREREDFEEEGVFVLIAGRANVGKTSLLNVLCPGVNAIVSDVPGTTRDPVEGLVELGGYAFRIFDTAGVRKPESAVEESALERARKLREQADVVVAVFDAGAPLSLDDVKVIDSLPGANAVVILNKTDLPPRIEANRLEEFLSERLGGARKDVKIIKTSTVTLEGIGELENGLVEIVEAGRVFEAAHSSMLNLRQKGCVAEIRKNVAGARVALDGGLGFEVAALELRLALDGFREIFGEGCGDDVLGKIFERFCVGK